MSLSDLDFQSVVHSYLDLELSVGGQRVYRSEGFRTLV
jgi:hypothetical protein